MYNPGNQKILVIDDERSIQRFLRPLLEEQGYTVLEALTGKDGIALFASENPLLVLLDLGLPDMDGLDVLAQLQNLADTPVIVLSARIQQEDKVEALDGGAVDYLTKPFGVGELTARIRAALRRVTRPDETGLTEIVTGALRINLVNHQIFVDGVEVHLTPIEFSLLAFMAHNAGKVVTHQQLLRSVWGLHASDKSHYLRIYIHQLRHKIEKEPARPRYVRTESGVGYRFMLE